MDFIDRVYNVAMFLLIIAMVYVCVSDIENKIKENHKELMNYITNGKTVVFTTDVTEGAEYSITIKRSMQ